MVELLLDAYSATTAVITPFTATVARSLFPYPLTDIRLTDTDDLVIVASVVPVSGTIINNNQELRDFQQANSITNTELYGVRFPNLGYDNAEVASRMQAGTLTEEEILGAS